MDTEPTVFFQQLLSSQEQTYFIFIICSHWAFSRCIISDLVVLVISLLRSRYKEGSLRDDPNNGCDWRLPYHAIRFHLIQLHTFFTEDETTNFNSSTFSFYALTSDLGYAANLRNMGRLIRRCCFFFLRTWGQRTYDPFRVQKIKPSVTELIGFILNLSRRYFAANHLAVFAVISRVSLI